MDNPIQIIGGLKEYAPKPVQQFAGEAIGLARDLKTVLSHHPLAYIANELVFPEPFADGTLKGAIQQHGYVVAPDTVHY